MAAMQEFLASFAVDVDEKGVGRLQEVLRENKTLAQDLAKAFESARASLKPLLTTSVTEALNGLKTSGALNLRLTADASAVVASAMTALASIKAAYSGTTLSIAAKVSGVGGDGNGSNGGITSKASGLMMSTGGRFTRRTRAEVAEDGQTEYIIPIQKEGTAVPMIRQMLSEMSSSARAGVLGSGGSKSVVSAPVNITVNSSGNQAEAIGRSVYNLTENYLVRNLTRK